MQGKSERLLEVQIDERIFPLLKELLCDPDVLRRVYTAGWCSENAYAKFCEAISEIE
jgi:hypothetical protein